MPNTIFWGFDCLTSPTRAGNSVGAVFAHRPEGRVLFSTLRSGEQIAAAGEAGVSIDDIQKSDVEVLRGAGIDIVERNHRLFISKMPAPIAFLTPAPTATPVQRHIGRHIG